MCVLVCHTYILYVAIHLLPHQKWKTISQWSWCQHTGPHIFGHIVWLFLCSASVCVWEIEFMWFLFIIIYKVYYNNVFARVHKSYVVSRGSPHLTSSSSWFCLGGVAQKARGRGSHLEGCWELLLQGGRGWRQLQRLLAGRWGRSQHLWWEEEGGARSLSECKSKRMTAQFKTFMTSLKYSYIHLVLTVGTFSLKP